MSLSHNYIHKRAQKLFSKVWDSSRRRQSAWNVYVHSIMIAYLWKCSLIRSSRVLSGKFATQRCRVSRTILHQLIRIHGGGLHARSFRARHSRNLFFFFLSDFSYLLLIFLVTKFRIDNYFFSFAVILTDATAYLSIFFLLLFFSSFLARQIIFLIFQYASNIIFNFFSYWVVLAHFSLGIIFSIDIFSCDTFDSKKFAYLHFINFHFIFFLHRYKAAHYIFH